MKGYNPKEWFNVIFLIQKSDTLIKLGPFMVVIFIYSLGIAWLEMDYLKIGKNSWVQNIPIMHSLLSFVISLLLVFRTNTAYDRWEGRKLWGQLVNTSRNLALKLAGILDTSDEESRKFFRRTIPIYSFALKEHLRSKVTLYMLDDKEDIAIKPEIDPDKHVPNQVAKLMFAKVNDLYKGGKITGDQLIILNQELVSFTYRVRGYT